MNSTWGDANLPGGAAGNPVQVYATGRDYGSGARIITFIESGIGADANVQQYRPVISGGVTTTHALYPANTVNGIFFPPGSDDLFLGVRASTGAGATQDYLVNIGQASIYRDATTPFAVPGLGNLGADLSVIFEENWSTRADVFWSVSGTPGPSAAGGDLARTLYATTPEGVPYERANPLLRANSSAQAAPTNKLTSLAVA